MLILKLLNIDDDLHELKIWSNLGQELFMSLRFAIIDERKELFNPSEVMKYSSFSFFRNSKRSSYFLANTSKKAAIYIHI